MLEGEPVASLSAVAYDAGFGFMGFYIVKPEQRGLGFGLEIWKAAIDYLGVRNIGLDGVLASSWVSREISAKRSAAVAVAARFSAVAPDSVPVSSAAVVWVSDDTISAQN
jgi:hypothetical protein